MSWDPVTYWTVRCDGQTTTGQCPTLLPSAEPSDHPVAWTPQGVRVLQPLLFMAAPPELAALRSEPVQGWLVTRNRVLCPEHVAAQGDLAAALIDGIPFEDEVD